METNHVNYRDASGRVYCHRLSEIVTLDAEHYANHCTMCSYLNGSANMRGVECKYDDKSNEKEVTFNDPNDAEKHSKMMYHRLGLMTEQEVIDSMDGYVDNVEEPEDDDDVAEAAPTED